MSPTHHEHGNIGRNTAIQAIERVASVVIGLVSMGVLTRYLGVHDFGLYSTALTYLQFFATLLDGGFTILVVQMLSEHNRDHGRTLGALMSFRLVSAGVCFLILNAAIFLLPYPRIVQWSVVAGSLGFIAILVTSVLTGVFRTKLAMLPVALSDAAIRVLYLIAIVVAAWGHWSLIAIMIGLSIANIVPTIYLWWSARKRLSFELFWDWPLIREAFTRLWPLTMSMIFTLVYFRADTMILSFVATPEAVGLYAAPYKVLEVLINLPHLFLALMLPFFTRSWQAKNNEELKHWWQLSVDVMMMILIPMVVGLYVVATPVMTLVAGQSFGVSGPLLQILIWSVAAIAMGTIANYVIVAANEQHRMVKWYAITMAVALVGYCIFIPLYSYWAAAWLTLIVECFIALMNIVVAYRLTRIKLSYAPMIKVIIAAAAMGVVVDWSAPASLFAQIVIGALVYSAIILLLGGIYPAMWRVLTMGLESRAPGHLEK